MTIQSLVERISCSNLRTLITSCEYNAFRAEKKKKKEPALSELLFQLVILLSSQKGFVLWFAKLLK